MAGTKVPAIREASPEMRELLSRGTALDLLESQGRIKKNEDETFESVATS
jgi:hypothetical protein